MISSTHRDPSSLVFGMGLLLSFEPFTFDAAPILIFSDCFHGLAITQCFTHFAVYRSVIIAMFTI